MDRALKKLGKEIKSDTKKEEKGLKHIEKLDRKRDKTCEMGKKEMMKKKGKK